MAGGSGFGPHFVWARLALVAVLVPLVVTVPVQSVGATVNRTAPIAATAPDPGVVWPTSDDAVGWPLSSPVRGGEDRRPVLARAGARHLPQHPGEHAAPHHQHQHHEAAHLQQGEPQGLE